jgi:putative NADH-flavin reductase
MYNGSVQLVEYIMGEENLTALDLFQILEERRLEAQEQTAILHKRITELRDELYDEIADSHKEIMTEIKELRLDSINHAKQEEEMLNKLDKRLTEIEKWKWLVVGGAGAVAFLILGGLEGLTALLK